MESVDDKENFEPASFLTKRIVWLAVIAMFLGVGGLLGSKAVYRYVKRWRARQITEQARDLGEKQRWAEAFQKTSIAYRLNPKDPEVLRVAGRLYARIGMEEALRFWKDLLRMPQATTADHCEYARMALHLQRNDLAGEEIQRLLERLPYEPMVLKVAAEWSAKSGKHSLAVQYARAACVSGAGDDLANLLLAQILMSSKDPLEEAQAKQELWKVIRRNGKGWMDACNLLVCAPTLAVAEMQELLGLLLQRPNPAEADRLVVEEIEMRLHPDSRERRLTAVVEGGKSRELEGLLVIGRWLNRQHEFQKTLDLISLEESFKSQELFLVRMDALAALKQWEEVDRVLKDRRAPLDSLLLELYSVRAAKERGDHGQVKAHWHRFFSLSVRQPVMLWYGAQYAEKIAEPEEAKKLYRQLSQKPATARQACAALVRMLEEEGDTKGLRDLMEDLVRQYPQDPSLLNDLSYLDLLLKRDVIRAKENALALVTKQPHLLAFRTTLALAWLRLEDPVSAYQLYGPVRVDWSQALPGWQAVHVAVLGANGQKAAAMELARQIPFKRLKPEERTLVQEYLIP